MKNIILLNVNKQFPKVFRCWIVIFSTALLIFSTPAYTAGWTAASTIYDIQFTPVSVYVQLDPGVVSNFNGCASWGAWFVIYNGTTTLNSFETAQVSAALAAKASGRQVSLYSAGCINTYNSLDYLQLK